MYEKDVIIQLFVVIIYWCSGIGEHQMKKFIKNWTLFFLTVHFSDILKIFSKIDIPSQ